MINKTPSSRREKKREKVCVCTCVCMCHIFVFGKVLSVQYFEIRIGDCRRVRSFFLSFDDLQQKIIIIQEFVGEEISSSSSDWIDGEQLSCCSS